MRAHELVYRMYFVHASINKFDDEIHFFFKFFLFINYFVKRIDESTSMNIYGKSFEVSCDINTTQVPQPFLNHPTINIYAIDIKSCKNIKVYEDLCIHNETSILERGNVPYKYRFEGHSSDYKF